MIDSESYPYTSRLLDLPRFASDGVVAINPGFERIELLLDKMGRPEKGYQIALVAGTNGKGSTCSMMAACLTAAGYKTGLHTSPHLLHVSERMRVDGKPPSFQWLEAASARYFQDFLNARASFFEATLALSLLWFADQKVSHAVVEVGLGGRLDATNTLNAEISVITGVALDHTELLGKTLPKIAIEKAGIIKPNKPIVVGNLPRRAKDKVKLVAHQRNAPFLVATDLVRVRVDSKQQLLLNTELNQYEGIRRALYGNHQLGNTATALCALEAWVGPLAHESIKNGLENVTTLAGLRGRSEVIRETPLLMIDVGHNPDAVRATLSAFASYLANSSGTNSSLSKFEQQKPVVLIGMLSDKDTVDVGRILAKSNAEVWTVPTVGARGLDSEVLAQHFISAGATHVRSFANVSEGLTKVLSEHRNCLVMGSHFVVSDVLGLKESY